MATILIADDDQVMLGLLSTLMELEGDQAVTVTRPEDIIPMAQKTQPVLIMMDYHLAGGDSITALRDLKRDPHLSHIPVLVASGMDYKLECLQAGAQEFILKPFRPTQLLETMHDMMQK